MEHKQEGVISLIPKCCILIIYRFIYIYMQNHNDTIIKTSEDFFKENIPLTLFVTFACERELETEQRLQYIDPHSYVHQRYVFLVLQGCSTGGPEAHYAGCGLSLPHLVTNGSPKLLGSPRTPAGWCSLYCILPPTRLLQLPDFLSPPSYIIVQSPTQSLEWHVWSSSSGNNCHAVQRSLSSGASVYECIMGFYLVPFPQQNPPTRSLSITGHWNVSLPSGASLWNGMFGLLEGQYTTQRSIYNTKITGRVGNRRMNREHPNLLRRVL